MDIINSAIATRATIVVAININTCAEYKPHIKIRHMTNVMIDAANKHMDKYRNIHKSYLIKLIHNTSILIKKTYNIANISKIVC